MNDLMVKDPNTLADLLSNLLKFRSYQIALVFDITKAYISIMIGLVESPDDEWRQFAFNCVQFGDRPAAALMTISMEKGSETYKEVSKDLNLPEDEVKEDSKKLLLDVYVNDGMTGRKKGMSPE